MQRPAAHVPQRGSRLSKTLITYVIDVRREKSRLHLQHLQEALRKNDGPYVVGIAEEGARLGRDAARALAPVSVATMDGPSKIKRYSLQTPIDAMISDPKPYHRTPEARKLDVGGRMRIYTVL